MQRSVQRPERLVLQPTVRRAVPQAVQPTEQPARNTSAQTMKQLDEPAATHIRAHGAPHLPAQPGRKAAGACPAAVTPVGQRNSFGGSMRGWAKSLPRRILRARTRFSKFFASTLNPNCAAPLSGATNLFPCPPLPEIRSAAPRNGHARARWSLRVATRRWANVALAVFSWEACGRPALAPATARCGTPLNKAQLAMAARLESRVGSLLRAGHAEPGRGTLISLQESCVDIQRRLEALGVEDSPYNDRSIRPEALGSTSDPRVGLAALDADRIDLPVRGATFNAADWMPADMKAAYLDPRTLTESASEELPGRKPRRRALSARVERELNSRLDSARILRLVPESLALEPADILATRKGWSEEEQAWRLRLLFDRRRRNAAERQLPSRAMQALAQGTDLCELQLRQSEDFRIDLKDLDNWYYQFKVSPERAASNVYGQPRPLSFFDGTHAKSEIDAQLDG